MLRLAALGPSTSRFVAQGRVPLHTVIPAARALTDVRDLSTAPTNAVSVAKEPDNVTVRVYRSENPTLWMVAGRLFSFKKFLGLTGAGATAWEAAQAAGASWNEVMDTLMGVGESAAAEAALTSMTLPVYFLLVAAFGHIASRAIVRRTVVGIDAIMPKEDAYKIRPIESRKEEIEASQDPYSSDLAAREEIAAAVHPDACKHHTVVIHRPKLWNNSDTEKETVPRSLVLCSPPNKLDTCFDLQLPSGRRQQQYLWPFPGKWSSDNRPYLVALLYQNYFLLKERAPPPDTRLLRGIEGFGPYRPAQFADPHHPAAQQLAADAAASPGGRLPAQERIDGTPFWIEKNAVWASFTIPPRATLEKRREAERMAALNTGGVAAAGRTAADLVMADTLPSIPAPVTLMLDGSHMSVDPVSPLVTLPPPEIEAVNEKAVPVASAIRPTAKQIAGGSTGGAEEGEGEGERFEKWGSTVVRVTTTTTTTTTTKTTGASNKKRDNKQ